MKNLRKIFIIIFFVLILIPVLTFNRKEDVVSKIDNRKLADNPFRSSSRGEEEVPDLSNDIENYAENRIGLRDQMIEAYIRLNDVLFHEMVHPLYTYGKDDYVFFQPLNRLNFQAYHVDFAQMVADLQEYCESRNVPFLFVLDPAKATVLPDKQKRGVNYTVEWVAPFEAELDKRGVHYVDNTDLMREKEEAGESVYNRQYDAGHWNDLGAYYGVNNILETLANEQKNIHMNQMDEFDISEEIMTTLPTSNFPIHENVPVFTAKNEIENISDAYEELILDKQYNYFRYTKNALRKAESAPKALVFQGSYMNSYGYKYFENSFSEYIAVHDYQNVLNLDYYFNIFQPDCVIFEAAEYAMLDAYFTNAAFDMGLNPALSEFDQIPAVYETLSPDMVSVEKGWRLSKVRINGLPGNIPYAYIEMNGTVYDLHWQVDDSYAVTVENENADTEKIKIIAILDQEKHIFQ